MTRILSAACLALLATVSLPAGAHGTGTTVKPLFHRAGDTWYEDPGAWHRVTRNPGKARPARLLAVFVLDVREQGQVLARDR